MDLKTHIEAIGKQFVTILADRLKNGTIALERAKEIANYYLQKLEKAQSEEEVQQGIQEIARDMPEMKDVVLSETIRQKNQQEQALREQAEALLKQGKVDEAAALARQIRKP